MTVRCTRHDFACGPGGQCVVCRREIPHGSIAPARPTTLWFAAIACVLAVAGGVGYRAREKIPTATPTAPSTGEAITGVSVIVYTTSWCPVCKRAKNWLRSSGVSFEERDIEGSSAYAREMRLINPRGSIPTIDVDGEVMVGFSEGEMKSMLEHAAQRRVRPL